MALDQRDVEIQSPCPIDLDAARMRGTGRNWHCGHCEKTVHVLSTMTETEARTFLRVHAGQDICVSYAMSPSGEVRFRPEPIVPVTSLRRRPAIAAVGLGLALAACAPHENLNVEAQTIMQTEALNHVIKPPQTPPPPPIVAHDIQVDGGMRVPEIEDRVVEGRMKPTVIEREPAVVTKRGAI